jgi:hypothetical protein
VVGLLFQYMSFGRTIMICFDAQSANDRVRLHNCVEKIARRGGSQKTSVGQMEPTRLEKAFRDLNISSASDLPEELCSPVT